MTTYKYEIGSTLKFSEKYYQDVTVERCVLCARKLGANPYYIETVYGAEVIAFGTGDQSDAGYSGCFPVGSECARQVVPEALGRL